MKNIYFRLYKFGDKVGTSITRAEAERAIYAMASGKAFLSRIGALAGSGILQVEPDYHRAMGYKEEYRGQIKLDEQSQRYLEVQKDCEELGQRVRALMESGKEHLIGKVTNLLDKPKTYEKN